MNVLIVYELTLIDKTNQENINSFISKADHQFMDIILLWVVQLKKKQQIFLTPSLFTVVYDA